MFLEMVYLLGFFLTFGEISLLIINSRIQYLCIYIYDVYIFIYVIDIDMIYIFIYI